MGPGATQEELKAAHRALVRRHHPDLAPVAQRDAATRHLQQINVAYGLVRDPARRAAYDAARSSSGSQMERLVTAAGVWAGRWWARNRIPLRRGAALTQAGLRAGGRMTRRAAAEALGRVAWLSLCVLGLALGWLAAWSAQRVVGTTGFLTPLTGSLGGLALGNQRGWLLRLRLVGVRMPRDAARFALVAWLAAMAVSLWLERTLV